MKILDIVEDDKFNDGKTLSPFCQVYVEVMIEGEPKRVRWGAIDRKLYQALRIHWEGERSVPVAQP